MRGATLPLGIPSYWIQISIHAPHAGSDSGSIYKHISPGISIHAPHAGSDAEEVQEQDHTEISIHAPHAGSDVITYSPLDSIADFNPRSPCGERRRNPERNPGCQNFNPRSPCGERLATARTMVLFVLFQSTLPMRGATKTETLYIVEGEFQSTLPMRGATVKRAGINDAGAISIHAPHAGSDPGRSLPGPSEIHFNPRSPCGERPQRVWAKGRQARFQSTLPMRGATRDWVKAREICDISIHAPHAGSDGTGHHDES